MNLLLRGKLRGAFRPTPKQVLASGQLARRRLSSPMAPTTKWHRRAAVCRDIVETVLFRKSFNMQFGTLEHNNATALIAGRNCLLVNTTLNAECFRGKWRRRGGNSRPRKIKV